jgi:virginiamycin B lyase
MHVTDFGRFGGVAGLVCGPHGLKEDKDGNIWYTGNTGSLIGKLDPKTGAVTEYKTPEPGDPHTLIFDQSGMQNANRIGRLDPKTGETKLLTPPTTKARPYGMALNSRGTFFCRIRCQQGRKR